MTAQELREIADEVNNIEGVYNEVIKPLKLAAEKGYYFADVIIGYKYKERIISELYKNGFTVQYNYSEPIRILFNNTK
jgi:hypothetical protein